MTELKIDFSCKHGIYIKNEDGTYTPMDEPYFEAEKVAGGVWKIKSDGDFSWLIEGEKEALVIDSGYGAGNIREHAQTLTDKPVKNIANIHYHFDHTANNAYFECAFMAEETKEFATIPYPSFDGIKFPRNYRVQIIGEGYVFDLGGRKLETLCIPDHTHDGLAFLDREAGILFSGDEISNGMQRIAGTVENYHNNMKKLNDNMDDIKLICSGFGVFKPDMIPVYLEATERILNGEEGKEFEMPDFPKFDETYEGKKVYLRFRPHPEDMPKHTPEEMKSLRMYEYEGYRIVYRTNRVFNVK